MLHSMQSGQAAPMQPAKIQSVEACDICGLGAFCFIQPASGFEAAGLFLLINR